MHLDFQWWMAPLLLSAGFLSGICNVMAGGGSLFVVPVLIAFFDLPSAVANGTNRVGLLVQNITAVLGFKTKKIGDIRISLLFSLPAILGAIAGAMIAIDIADHLFKKILSIVMLLVLCLILLNPKRTESVSSPLSFKRTLATCVAFFFVGLYGGFIQIGVGFIILLVMSLIAKTDLVSGNSHKVFVVGIYTFAAVVVFAMESKIDWPIAFILSIGNGLGGWYGSRLAMAGGEKWIRAFLTVSVVALSIKLGLF